MPKLQEKEASLFGLGSRISDSRVARVLLLALGTGFLLTLPLREARAQTPQIDPCLTDPSRCLPNLDPCVADPASCLPERDDVEPCVAKPASCLPEPDDVDPCISSPSSCLPGERDVEECLNSPGDCLDPPDRDDREDDRDDGDTDQPGAAPGGNANRPGGNDGARGDGPEASSGARSGIAQPPVSLTPAEASPQISLTSETPTVLERVGHGLIDAAERFSFPLLLGASVAAFLLIQGRIDRKDPKLAAAPVDSRDDMVLFR